MANSVTDFLNTFKTGANAASTLAPLAPKIEEKFGQIESEIRSTGEDVKEGAIIYGVSTLSMQLVSTIAVSVIAIVAVLNYNRARRG